MTRGRWAAAPPVRWAFAEPRPAGGAGAECWLGDAVSAPEAEALAAAAAAAGCEAVQLPPVRLAAVIAQLRPTPVRVAAAIAGPGALVSTKLFAAGECLRLGADEIAWPLAWPLDGPLEGAANAAALSAEIAAAASLCHAAGARLKLLLPAAALGAALPLLALPRGADAVAGAWLCSLPPGSPARLPAAPAGAVAGIFEL